MGVNYIVEEEKKFWKKWKSESNNIVMDGIVCPEKYLSSGVYPRLLFLMKEVNGGNDWDLRTFLHNGGRPQSWDNIARWVEGIRRIDEEIRWSELEKLTDERRKTYLPEICVVNVKKTSGGHTSVGRSIKKAAKDNAETLKRQIEIYQPELIICCGTGSYYYDNIMEYDGTKPQWEQTSRGIGFVREENRIMISYLHPAARVKDCVLYYGLMDAVKEVMHCDVCNG